MIKNLNIESYGIHQNREFPFEKFNIIYGPNEAGKSTMLDAIKSSIFGFDVKQKRSHIYGQSDISINADFEDFTINRVLKSSARYTITSDDETKSLEGLAPGYMDISRKALDNVFWLNSNSIDHMADADWTDISRALTSTLNPMGKMDLTSFESSLSGEFSARYGRSVNSEKTLLNSRIKDAKRREQEALDKSDRIRELQKICADLELELEKLKQEKVVLDRKKNEITDLKSRTEKNRQETESLESQAKKILENTEDERRKYSEIRINAALGELTGQTGRIIDMDRRRSDILRDIDDLKEDQRQLQLKIGQETDFRPGVDIESAKTISEDYEGINFKKEKTAAFVLILVFAILIFFVRNNLGMAIGATAVFLVLSAVIAFFWGQRRNTKMQLQRQFMEAIKNDPALKPMLLSFSSDYYERYKAYLRDGANMNLISKGLNEKSEILKELDIERTNLLGDYSGYSADILVEQISENDSLTRNRNMHANRIDDLDREYAEILKELEIARSALQTAESYLESNFPDDFHDKYSLNEISIEEVREKLHLSMGEQKNLDYDEYAYGERLSAENELEELNIDEAHFKLFKKFFELCEKEFRQQNQPEYIKMVNKYLSYIMPDTKIYAEEEGPSAIVVSRGSEEYNMKKSSLSLGTKQQIAFCYRLALMDVLDPDKTIPIFADDIFAFWDEERQNQGIELLVNQSGRQVFYCSCKESGVNSILEYLKNKGELGINYILI